MGGQHGRASWAVAHRFTLFLPGSSAASHASFCCVSGAIHLYCSKTRTTSSLLSLPQLDPPLYAHLEARECLSFFFCYRWLLILMKREFAFEEVSAHCGALHGMHAGHQSQAVGAP